MAVVIGGPCGPTPTILPASLGKPSIFDAQKGPTFDRVELIGNL